MAAIRAMPRTGSSAPSVPVPIQAKASRKRRLMALGTGGESSFFNQMVDNGGT